MNPNTTARQAGLTEHQWHEVFAAKAINGAMLNVRMAVEIVMETLAAHSADARNGEPEKKMYVACYECSHCGHMGINDESDTESACGYSCGWYGPSPVEDKCPGCDREGTMTSACPECGSLYSVLAEVYLPVTSNAVHRTDARNGEGVTLTPEDMEPMLVAANVPVEVWEEVMDFAAMLLAAPAAPAPTDLAPCIGQCGNAVLASGDRICHECREAAPAPAAQAATEPPLLGHWHGGNGVLCCGTMRIFGEDFDTDPTEEFKQEIMQWVCETLNAALRQQSATPADVASEADKSQAARDVLAERQRQISAEGWTPEHDDEHDNFDMAYAAACYAMADDWPEDEGTPEHWPWAPHWWKPKSARQNLVRAGALILAEIERRDRAVQRERQQGEE